MNKRVLIAGGGITGLTAAYRLRQKAKAAGDQIEIIVVERDDRLGGKTQTDVFNGFVVEAGPDSFIGTKPWAKQLCEELGLPLVGTNPKCTTTYIYHRGRFEQLPVGMQLMIPTQVMPFVTTRLISPLGKLRAAMEPFIPVKKSDEDESIGGFVRRRFGTEVLENIAGPLMGGIYGGDWDNISLKASFPMFMKMEQEQGSLLMAAQKQKKNAPPRPKGPTGFSMFMTVPTGLRTLVDAVIQASEGVEYRTGTALTALGQLGGGRYIATLNDRETLEVDAVVLALPANVTAPLVQAYLPEVADELAAIPYGSSAVVALGYDKATLGHPLDASGFLVPKDEPLDITASTWVSSKWAHAAPEGKALLRCFLGRSGGKDWAAETDEKIIQAVRTGLKTTMGVTAEPEWIRVFRWPKAMSQYRVGHLDRMDRVDELMKAAPGLYLAGAAYRGVGLPDCIREGTQAAEKVAQHIGLGSAAKK